MVGGLKAQETNKKRSSYIMHKCGNTDHMCFLLLYPDATSSSEVSLAPPLNYSTHLYGQEVYCAFVFSVAVSEVPCMGTLLR